MREDLIWLSSSLQKAGNFVSMLRGHFVLLSPPLTLHLKGALACLCLLTLLPACHDMARVDSKGIKQEMEARTVYHINDNQLAQGATAVGERLVRRLDSAIAAGRAADAGWQSSIVPVLEQYAAPYRIEVRVLLFDSIQAFKASPKERQVLDAMLYTFHQGQPVPENIQKLEDKSFQYIHPVTLPDVSMVAHAPGQPAPAGRGEGTPAIYHLRIPSRPAALEASKGLKGMK